MSYEHVLRTGIVACATAAAYFAGRNDERDDRGPWWALFYIGVAAAFVALP